VALNITLAWLLLRVRRDLGMPALAFSIANTLEAAALLWLLRGRIGGLGRDFVSALARMLLATLVLGAALLATFAATPAARRAIACFREPRPDGPPPWFPARLWPLWFVAFAFDHNRRFGLLFVLGLVLDALWVRWAQVPVFA
jgi:hypothetical protein